MSSYDARKLPQPLIDGLVRDHKDKKESEKNETILIDEMDKVKEGKPNQAEIDQIKMPGGPL